MNPVVEKKRKQRFEYMNALYEATDGRELSYIDMAEIGMAIHLSRAECEGTVEYLAGEGLLRYVALGGTIAITHLGVIEVETALQKPDEPTTHFPAVHNTINIGTMSNSVIQQGGDGSMQSAEIKPCDLESISAFLTELSSSVSQLPLAPDEMEQLSAELKTLKAQIVTPKPQIRVVVNGLKYIMGVLSKIGTSLLTSAALSHLPAIEAFLHLH
jgi:hypothetical protein